METSDLLQTEGENVRRALQWSIIFTMQRGHSVGKHCTAFLRSSSSQCQPPRASWARAHTGAGGAVEIVDYIQMAEGPRAFPLLQGREARRQPSAVRNERQDLRGERHGVLGNGNIGDDMWATAERVYGGGGRQRTRCY